MITTNFDKIYDGLCNEDTYMILDYKSTKDITSAVKSPYNLIIKAHGNIDNTDDIIFTSEQYFNAQQVYSNFYSLLHALFLTHTVVFLGYSLSDPDINLVLSNLHNTASPNSPHYIIIKDDSNSIHVQNHWRVSYNINCLEMGQSFDEVNCNLKELRDSVVSLRQERGINQ